MSRTSAASTVHVGPGLHVGIIMDGNGRWAAARGLPRSAGHHAGVRTARAIVEGAVRAGIGTLTLYAFSADNWSRPTPEVRALMRLLRRALHAESKRCLENGVRLSIVGRRDRLPAPLRNAIADAEALTARGRNLHLRVAIDYSARDSIVRAAERYAQLQTARATSTGGAEPLTREQFTELLSEAQHDARRVPDVDLLVRTGGEQRLSDFMLWECAYAELYFTSCMWPDFGEDELLAALRAFDARERRFGGVPEQVAS
ncbi:MAG TPA: polyprenyl diphosphate synthase [Gemmatimonadaceae bacterium]|nr:polyprenyl diphosphate synthase [Gemmatimonadaceae bacterium]